MLINKPCLVLGTLVALLACGPSTATQARAQETGDHAALHSRFDLLSQRGKRGVFGPVRELYCNDARGCEAPGLLLRAHGRGPLSPANRGV